MSQIVRKLLFMSVRFFPGNLLLEGSLVKKTIDAAESAFHNGL